MYLQLLIRVGVLLMNRMMNRNKHNTVSVIFITMLKLPRNTAAHI